MNILDTINFVKAKHDVEFGQKYGDKPYSYHLEGVANLFCEKFPDATNDAIHAAYLHDVIEDTDVTERELFDMGYSQETIDMVSALTHKDGDYYNEYFQKIVNFGDVWVRRIKYCDSSFNLSHTPKNPDKYKRNLRALENLI